MDPADLRPEHDAVGRPPSEEGRSWTWPLAITLGLLLVVLVNVGFIVVAVSGADEVVESYTTEER